MPNHWTPNNPAETHCKCLHLNAFSALSIGTAMDGRNFFVYINISRKSETLLTLERFLLNKCFPFADSPVWFNLSRQRKAAESGWSFPVDNFPELAKTIAMMTATTSGGRISSSVAFHISAELMWDDRCWTKRVQKCVSQITVITLLSTSRQSTDDIRHHATTWSTLPYA